MTQATPAAGAAEPTDQDQPSELELRLSLVPAHALGAFQAAFTVELAVREADADGLPVPSDLRAMPSRLLAWARDLTR